MAKIQLNLGDPSGKTYRVDIEEENKLRPFIGMILGQEIDGGFLGFDGYTFKITGGSDTDGFPMNPSVQGAMRKKILSSGGIGFRPTRRGERRRKSVRGNTISEDILQINMKILSVGSKKIEEILATLKTD
jgi:small subunit ribosomal protein S6e